MNVSLSAQNIVKHYGGVVALSDGNLDVHSGEVVALIGANGSGKSTLLRILAFLEGPARGRVFFEGRLCSSFQRGMGGEVTMLSQEPYLLKRSVKDNVSYGLKLRGARDRMDKVTEVLHRVGLDPDKFSGRSWHQLSGGEAQRVALAARLVLRPKVLLLDEPTASLDKDSAARIKAASLAARTEWGTSLVVVSHDLPWLESVCDNILVLADGRLAT